MSLYVVCFVLFCVCVYSSMFWSDVFVCCVLSCFVFCVFSSISFNFKSDWGPDPKDACPLRVGPEPSSFEDLCLVNVSVKYFSKLCFGTIKIQPELKYLKTILEVFTSWFQRAKALEHKFGRVPSISFIFTGSKMARICKGIYYKYFEVMQCQDSSIDRGFSTSSVGPGFTSCRDSFVMTCKLRNIMHFIKQNQ